MRFSWRLAAIVNLAILGCSPLAIAGEGPAIAASAVVDPQSVSSSANAQEATSLKTSGLKWSPDSLTIAATPLSYAFVRGNKDRYRQMEWRTDGAMWGTPEYSLTEGDEEDVFMELKGHDMIRNGDYGNELLLSKKGLGFLEFNFDQYRKYFDGSGGVMPGFSQFHVIKLDRDLYLDIGKIEVEAGLRMEDVPEVTLKYEHEYKEGAKSRLTWGGVVEGLTRKTAPSWQEVDESVDVFEIEAAHQVAGFDIDVDQRFEDISTRLRRYERNYSVNTTASQNITRIQDQQPESFYSGTGLRASRWALEDKIHSSFGYHYQYIKTTEWESLKEYNVVMAPTCASTNCENKDGAFSTAQSDLQDFVWSGDYFPTKNFSTGLKLKAGFEQRHADSDYPGDYTAPNPDGIPNRIEKSYTTDQRHNLAQTITLRYTGIPNTSLYTDLSLEQRRSWISEDRQSIGVQGTPSSGESWERETIWNPRTEAWTAGVSYSPNYRFTVIPQLRLFHSTQDYDDKRETVGTGAARSAFVDKMKYSAVEYSTRAMYRPTGWLHTGFKYMLQNNLYASRAENETYQDSTMLNNSYSFDTYLYPRSDLSFSSVLTLYDSAVRTPASNNTAAFGTFKSDVASWMVGADYAPFEDLSIHQDIYYSWANNYEDFSQTGLPYGAAFNRVGYTIKFDWTRFKKWKLGPIYSFSHYGPNPDYDAGRYTAHLLGMDIAYAWE